MTEKSRVVTFRMDQATREFRGLLLLLLQQMPSRMNNEAFLYRVYGTSSLMRGPTAEAVTEPEARRADRRPRQP